MASALTTILTIVLLIHVYSRGTVALPRSGLLMKTLLDPNKYDRRVIPTSNGTGSPKIKIGVVVEQINQLCNRREELHWAGFVRVIWNDPLLVWEPASWDNQTHIFLKEGDIWVPDVSILERLDDDIGFKEQKRRLLYITYKGDVKWVLGGDLIVTRCPLYIYKFPFDHQTCTMLVGSYTIPRHDLETVDPEQSGYSPIANENALWSVTGTESSVVNFTYDSDIGTLRYDFIQFKIHFQRKSLYYSINIITPLIMMSGLMVVTFFIPPDSGEKIGFGITLLLAFNVIQLVITDNMPHTSDSSPIVSVYVTVLLAMSALLIPLAVLAIYVNKYGYSFFPMFIQRRLGDITHNTEQQQQQQQQKQQEQQNAKTANATFNHNSTGDNGNIEWNNLGTEEVESNVDNQWDEMKADVLKYVCDENRRRRSNSDRESREATRRERYEKAARKIDMFCLKLFTVALITSMISCTIAMIV